MTQFEKFDLLLRECGEEISLSTGDWLKIAPAAKRQFFASDISREFSFT